MDEVIKIVLINWKEFMLYRLFFLSNVIILEFNNESSFKMRLKKKKGVFG